VVERARILAADRETRQGKFAEKKMEKSGDFFLAIRVYLSHY
jgi:hypothetical protein